MLPRLELPARGIPQTGLIPTGAVAGSSRTKFVLNSLNIVRLWQSPINIKIGSVLDDRKDYTMAHWNQGVNEI